MKITEQEALELLDLDRFEEAIDKMAPHASQNQFDTMVCLAYNIGISAFRQSTVLKQHTAANYQLATNAFKMWNKGGGVVLSGLVKRRESERSLYSSRCLLIVCLASSCTVHTMSMSVPVTVVLHDCLPK